MQPVIPRFPIQTVIPNLTQYVIHVVAAINHIVTIAPKQAVNPRITINNFVSGTTCDAIVITIAQQIAPRTAESLPTLRQNKICLTDKAGTHPHQPNRLCRIRNRNQRVTAGLRNGHLQGRAIIRSNIHSILTIGKILPVMHPRFPGRQH